MQQAHVIDHQKGAESKEPRNVMSESARIARGAVQPLSQLKAASVDALVFPGGFGAAKNLSDFGFKGTDMKVLADVERVIREFHKVLTVIYRNLYEQILRKNSAYFTGG